jgi:hypothetical protein
VKLFLDLDGVLADFDHGVQAVTGRRPEELPLKTMWAALSRAPRFFETLAFMHDAKGLWRFCEPHHPAILTGLPRGTWAPEQKKRWVSRMLGAHGAGYHLHEQREAALVRVRPCSAAGC